MIGSRVQRGVLTTLRSGDRLRRRGWSRPGPITKSHAGPASVAKGPNTDERQLDPGGGSPPLASNGRHHRRGRQHRLGRGDRNRDRKPAEPAEEDGDRTGHSTVPTTAGADDHGNKLARIAPLTGVVDPTGAVAKRCAVTVKIGNTKEAHPQSGVGSADVVYEVVVDGGITRLAAVYQSHTPDKVGPLRSVRPSDQQILWPLGGVFAYSGGNAMEVGSLNGVPVIAKDETAAGPMMFRDPARVGAAQPVRPRRPAVRRMRLASSAAAVRIPRRPPAGGWQARFGGHDRVQGPRIRSPGTGTPSWASGSGGMFGGPDLGASGGQLNTTNVVVMSVGYLGGPGGIDTEVQLVGSGPLSVYTAGRVITGTWSRADKAQPVKLRDAANKPIRLTPGPTWVELPDVSYPVTTKP